MEKFNWSFGSDRFTLYKTWSHDSSIVYRLTTWTNLLAAGASFFTPTKISVVFLKVQISNCSTAYETLKKAGLELDQKAKHGLKDDVGTMVLQKAAPWRTTGGADIKNFCRKNINQIRIAMEEVGHLRIFLIVWEPEAGKAPRMQGFKEFATEKFKAQLTMAEWDKVIKAPFRFAGKLGTELLLSDVISS